MATRDGTELAIWCNARSITRHYIDQSPRIFPVGKIVGVLQWCLATRIVPSLIESVVLGQRLNDSIDKEKKRRFCLIDIERTLVRSSMAREVQRLGKACVSAVGKVRVPWCDVQLVLGVS